MGPTLQSELILPQSSLPTCKRFGGTTVSGEVVCGGMVTWIASYLEFDEDLARLEESVPLLVSPTYWMVRPYSK